MTFLEADLLRRGHNQNNVPARQVFAYMDKFEDLSKMENPFIGGDD